MTPPNAGHCSLVSEERLLYLSKLVDDLHIAIYITDCEKLVLGLSLKIAVECSGLIIELGQLNSAISGNVEAKKHIVISKPF
jgi:hypothetical protein